MTTVNWVLTNGFHQVTSVNHLLCIASLGNGYTLTGTPPASQALFASSKYLQANDIECSGTAMVPIGNFGGISFSGTFNGNGFQIQNWQNSQTTTADNQGLFGNAGGSLLNITMSGVIKVRGGSNVGAVLGYSFGLNMINTTVIFSTGSTVTGLGNTVGGAVGYGGQYSNVTCGRISGSVAIQGVNQVGGYVGNTNYSSIQDVINSISGTIRGADSVGGILGGGGLSGANACINQMTGDITATGNNAGGIAGSNGDTTNCTNNMIGNITAAGFVGGVTGNNATFINVINTMTGNIVSTNSTSSGGIGFSRNLTYTRCALAMNGNAPHLLMNDALITNQLTLTTNVYSNKFGMTINNAVRPFDATLNTVIQSFNTFPFALTTAGTIKMWDAVKSVPYFVFTYTDSNGVVRNIRSSSSGFNVQTIAISAPSTTNQFANTTLTWSAIPSNGFYQIKVNAEDAVDTISIASTSALTAALSTLACGTSYIASLYTSSDNATFTDTGNRVSFNTPSCSTLNKNPTAQTVLSPIWTAVNTLTSYQVTVKNVSTAEFVSAGPTSALTADTTGLITNTYYVLTLQGSTDGTSFVRLATPVTHTTLPLVLWTLNATSDYEVKTLVHLSALASNGAGFASGSIVPPNYSTAKYAQANNIDCVGTVMIPIGSAVTFAGTFDGKGFAISNWQNNQTSTAANQGLFANSGGSLLNITMTGIIKVKGANNVGSVVGNNSGRVINTVINFATGSTINGSACTGGVIGFGGQYVSIQGGRISGSVSITGTSQVAAYCGNVNYSSVVDVISSINGNITGTTFVGGIFGGGGPSNGAHACINNMTGNIVCSGEYAGGVAGAGYITSCTNNMRGNITASRSAGGICGSAEAFVDVINTMTGDIISTTSSVNSGGIGFSYTTTYTRCVLAMNGNAPHLLMNDALIANQLKLTTNVYTNKFGLKINGVVKLFDATLNTVVQSFNTFPFALTTAGEIKMWDSVNSVPYFVYTYTDGTGIVRTIRITDSGYKMQTIAVSAPSTTNQFANTSLTWAAIPSNGFYQIRVNAEDTTDVISKASVTTLTTGLSSLACGTAYIASLYASTNNTTFTDTGNRVYFVTPSCSIFNKNPTATTILSPFWTAVNTLTSYRVTVKNAGLTEFVSAGPTSSLTANTTGLVANVYYVLTLQGSSDGATFTRLAAPVTHTTLPLVLWTQDAALNYQIGSLLHIDALAANGAGYASGLIVPLNYSTAKYAMMNDIDCAGFVMTPIGVSVAFAGTYDGKGYRILNWQNNQSTTANNQGFMANSGGSLLNISMGGVIKIKGGNNTGSVVGNNFGRVINTTIVFASGSTVIGTSCTGGAVGNGGQYNAIQGGRISGSVSITGTSQTGGFLGNANYGSVQDVISTINGNITGTTLVGGIHGSGGPGSGTVGCVNNMTGNITCSGANVGGISGGGETSTCTNNMTGNVTGTSAVGGITGSGGAFTDVINTMTGSVISTTSSSNSGGIGFSGNNSFTRCVVATNGNVPHILMNEALFPAITFVALNNVYSNRFNMKVNNVTASVLSNAYYKQVPLTSFPTAELTTAGSIKLYNPILNVPYWTYPYSDNVGVARTTVADPMQTAVVASLAVLQPTGSLINGALTLTVSGGQFQSYNYSWTRNGTAFSGLKNLTALDQGVYQCVITSGSSSATVSGQIFLGLMVVAGAVTAPTTISTATGSIAAPAAIGGTGPYTFKWSVLTGASFIYVQTAAQTGLLPGNYSLKVTDAGGNFGTIAYTIPNTMVVVPTITNASTASNGAITLAVTNAAAPFTYAWSYYGAPVATTQNLTGLKAGVYDCKITSAAETKNISITVPGTFALLQQLQLNGTVLPLPASSITGPTNASVFVAGPAAGQKALQVNADAIRLPYIAGLNYISSAAFSFGGWVYQTSSATSHVLSNAGNTGALSGLSIEFTNASSIAVQGWSNNASTALITSANATILNTWVHVWVTFDGSIMTLNVNGVSVGSSALTSAITFTSTTGWIIGHNSARDTTPFNGAICDVRFYSGFVAPAVASGPQLTLSIGTVTDSLSSFFGNGRIAPSTAPVFTSIVWNSTGSAITDQTLASKIGLLPGVYGYTITIASGLTGWVSTLISGPVATTISNNQSSTGSNGALTVSAIGGTGVYGYLWSNGAATASITGLAPGVYTCTVTSGRYTASITERVTAPISLIPTATTMNVFFPSVTDALYTVQYVLGTVTTTFVKNSAFSNILVTGLKPNTNYQFLVFDRSTLLYKTRASTLVGDSVSSYTAAAITVNNVVSIQNIPSTATLSKEQIINTVLSTGTVVAATYQTSDYQKLTVETKVVTNLSTISIPTVNGALLIPFDVLESYTQFVNLTLRDSTTVKVPYNPVNDSVFINGTVLQAGQSTILDGRVLTVQSV